MNFDRLAPHYRWIEALFAGGRLQRCRTSMLDVISAPKSVLIYGEGNGRFLVELIRRFPQAAVTVVEASAVMVDLARSRLQRDGLESAAVTFVQADALTWEPPASSFDLIVTCFFLDCFQEDQLQKLMPVFANAATPDAQWLLADFQIAPSGLRRLRSRVIVVLLYAFFRQITRISARELVDVQPYLRAAGFMRREHRKFDHGLLFCDWWSRGEIASQTRRIT